MILLYLSQASAAGCFKGDAYDIHVDIKRIPTISLARCVDGIENSGFIHLHQCSRNRRDQSNARLLTWYHIWCDIPKRGVVERECQRHPFIASCIRTRL